MYNEVGEIKSLLNKVMDELNTVLPFILERFQKYFGLTPSLEYVKQYFSSTIHVVIHELAHSIIKKKCSWIDEIEEDKHVFINEVLARFIERRISTEIKEKFKLETVFVESFKEQLMELKMYPELKNLKITLDEYAKLYDTFNKHIDSQKSLEEFCKYLSKYYESITHIP